MVENIVRHLNRREAGHSTSLEQIRAAAHEVQRPVFYAIAIIITAYLPIFTLQRVEGKLFKPMAWTVAFALLGALDLLHAGCAGTGEPSCSEGRQAMAEPGDGISDARYRSGGRLGVRKRWVTVGVAAVSFAGCDLSGLQRRDRIGIPAASRRRRHLGARHFGSQHGPDRGRARRGSGPPGPMLLSRSPAGRHPGRAPRRRHGHHRLFQHGILRRPSAEGAMAAGLSPGQRALDRRHEPRTGEDSRRDLGFFATHLRQPGGSGERRQRRARREDLRRRSQDAGSEGR